MTWKVQLIYPFLIEKQMVKRHKQKKYLRDFISKRIVKIVGNGRAEGVGSSSTKILTAYKIGVFKKVNQIIDSI